MSDADLEAIFEEPSRVRRILDFDQGAGMDEYLESLRGLGVEKEVLEEFKNATKSPEGYGDRESESWQPEAKPAFLDIDKSWHGIHFLLTGSGGESEDAEAGLLAFILQGGREIPSDDFGYGPPRAFTADEVQEIHRALNGIDPEELYEKADQSKLSSARIYPQIWDRETKEECIGYLKEFFKQLQNFVKRTAESRRALIAYIG